MRNERPGVMQEAWLVQLRARFVDVARGRVPEGAVDDVVQDAMTIIFQKAGARPTHDRDWEPPLLPWCFQVLRNVIGNHYQKERTRSQLARPESAVRAGVEEFTARRRGPTPIESLESKERSRLLREAIGELSAQDEFCGRHFAAVLSERKASLATAAAGGGSPASGASTSTSTTYVRFFRCREKLRRILLRMGYLP